MSREIRQQHFLHWRGLLGCWCACLALVGCASTKVEFSGSLPAAPMCQTIGQTLSALVLWQSDWRPDQKDVAQREAAAFEGLQRFFSTSGCYASFELRRSPEGRFPLVASQAELPALVASRSPPPDRVLVVTLRELGPTLQVLGSASLLEGATTVVLDIAAFDARSTTSLAAFQVYWRHGGALVVKGVASLPQDMSAAMAAALSSASLGR